MRNLLLLSFVVVLFTGSSSPYREPLTNYVPIMMNREQLNTSFAALPAQGMKATGKLYKFNNVLFVIEPGKGIHVFDNTNSSQPLATGFLRIPGCVDMALKDGFLYADNAIDLITIDISNTANIRVVNRIQNVFPETLPPDKLRMPIAYSKDKRPKDLIVVGWELKAAGE